MTRRAHLAHLVNATRTPMESSLAEAQVLTFESMRRARAHAAEVADVELLTAQFPEDHAIIPPWFERTPDLERSVADLFPFSNPRKLPLIGDLVDRLYRGSAATHLIYTNVDIILHPTFYEVVAARIAHGLDAFIINRRRVPAHLRSVSDLPTIWASPGKPHPGFDCFVFHRDLVPSFQFGQVCIGVPFVEMIFSQNLFCHARRFELFRHDHLTFHVGMEIFKKRDPEYLAYNRRAFWAAIRELEPDLDSRKLPWGDRSVLERMLRWGLHPAIPIRLGLMLEPRRWRSHRP